MSQDFLRAIERMKRVRIAARIGPRDPFGFVLDAQQEFARIAVQSMENSAESIAASNTGMAQRLDGVATAADKLIVELENRLRRDRLIAVAAIFFGIGNTLIVQHLYVASFSPPEQTMVIGNPKTLCSGTHTKTENDRLVCRVTFDLGPAPVPSTVTPHQY